MNPSSSIEMRFFAPPPELAACITTFYRMDLTVADGGRVHDQIQPEWANLRFFSGDRPVARIDGSEPLAGARFHATGPSSAPNGFELGTTRMWGVGLLPLGWAKGIGEDASEFADRQYDGELHPAFARFAPLCDALEATGCDDEAGLAVLLDTFRHDGRKHPDEDRIRAIHAAMVDTDLDTVADFAERAGLGTRTLERLCLRHFGFPPKRLLRRQRFMRSLAAFMLSNGGNWTAAIDSHYHDQSHFSRDFHAFMGMTPSEYAAQEHPILGAFMAERARILGSAAQTLDRPD